MGFRLEKVHAPSHSDHDLTEALFRILEGICNSWQLSPTTELAEILQRQPSTVSDWFTRKHVHVSPSKPSPNDLLIYEFIDFYDSVSSLFLRSGDQIKWLRSVSTDFGNRSLLQLLKTDPKNIYALHEWINHTRQP